MADFAFGGYTPDNNSLVAIVPAGIETKASLLDALRGAMLFPDYFGGNWDALEECIRDLSWLPRGDVVIIHKEVPLMGDPASLKMYLSILHDTVKKWRASRQRRFCVFFPAGSEEIIESAAQ